MSPGEIDNGREDPIARVLILYKKGEQNFFFFSYLSFFLFQYNLMHYYQLRTITIKLVCQTMMNVGVFNKYLKKYVKWILIIVVIETDNNYPI